MRFRIYKTTVIDGEHRRSCTVPLRLSDWRESKIMVALRNVGEGSRAGMQGYALMIPV